MASSCGRRSIVRLRLQDEFLRLHRELGVTVVFVTHDIDEAIKLGDKVAVFGRGGVLQQYADPAFVLSNPANEHVAEFVGADRGYRGLQFFHATGLPLHEVAHVTEDEVDALALQPGDWTLVIKDGKPYAWMNADGADLHRQGKSLYDSTIGGGSFFPPDGTLRQALDAALSSPSGLGVAVDDSGHLIGGVRADDVLEALREQRRLPELG